MFGISSTGKEAINKAVEDIFDRLALQLLGVIPRLAYKKLLIINTKPKEGLAHIFLQAMGNKTPNALEGDALKSMLESSHGYIDALKAKTRANLTEAIDGLAKEARIAGTTVPQDAVRQVIKEELARAGSHMKTIVEAESSKLRNVGSALDINRTAASVRDTNPLVFFVVTRDGKACNECLRLHLNEDGTPRVWRFSELKQGYHKRGEPNPSAFGLHPHCRCTLVYLGQGYTFDGPGKIVFKSLDHDELEHQRSMAQKKR